MNPQSHSVPPSNQPAAGGGPAQQPAPTPDVTTVLAQYGQAMMHLGQLERDVQQLRAQLQTATPPQGAAKEAPEVQSLVKEKDRLLKEKDNAINTLRLQVTALNGQLADTQHKLKLAAEGAYMLHKRRKRRGPWRRLLHWLS